jgi:hypothetical protein
LPRGTEETTKTIRIFAPAKIWSRSLQNANQNRYCLSWFAWSELLEEEYSLLGHNPMSWRNVSPPQSSNLKSKPSKKPAESQLAICFCLFLGWCILQPWRWEQYVSRKHWAVSELHGVAIRNLKSKTRLLITQSGTKVICKKYSVYKDYLIWVTILVERGVSKYLF